ncbi:low temperature requirement protein A [Francisella sp. 19X1-34]|uniref:low temperature requirement protein A n=1 Tax=Francisella sp. 19X1-34 TaxID=3087177 RepID=UPI002E2FC8EA|nr:low temperature requirement protein A [Francisella sp. 19X1-34]MED7787681.1 low temperature requirement protein A [Francisella sp. 19X1-34]
MSKLYFSENRQATWLELFFDLVFVAVIGVISHSLSHTEHNHISIESLFSFFLVFVPLWWVWASYTLYLNRYDQMSHYQKYITLGLMGLIIAQMYFTKDALNSYFVYFLIFYTLMRLLISLAYIFSACCFEFKKRYALKMSRIILFGAFISGLSLFVDGHLRILILYLGIIVDIVLQVRLKEEISKFSVHIKHLTERVGLLALIILGESIITIVNSFASIKQFNILDIVDAVVGFILIAQIWWIFFGSLHRLEKAKNLKTGYVLILSHLPFYIGLIFLASLIHYSIIDDLNQRTFALMAITGMALFYIGKQIPYLVAFPPYRWGIVFNSIVSISITAIASFCPKIEYSLIIMSLGLFVYIQLNVCWLIPTFDIDEYLTK